MATDIHGEEELGKAYDARLIRRLWTFVRPYRRVFWAALILSPVSQSFELVRPFLMKLGVDRYIANHDVNGLTRLGVVYLAAMAGQLLAYYFQQYLTMVVAQRRLSHL